MTQGFTKCEERITLFNSYVSSVCTDADTSESVFGIEIDNDGDYVSFFKCRLYLSGNLR